MPRCRYTPRWNDSYYDWDHRGICTHCGKKIGKEAPFFPKEKGHYHHHYTVYYCLACAALLHLHDMAELLAKGLTQPVLYA